MSKTDTKLSAVCLPRLSLTALLLIRVRHGRGCPVYFDLYPRYAKVLLRWLRVPDRALLYIISWVFGLHIFSVSSGAAFRGSPANNIDVMERVGSIVEALAADFSSDGWVQLLGHLIGEEQALAYYHRRFSRDRIWPPLMAVSLARENLEMDTEEMLVAWDPTWPPDWMTLVERELSHLSVRAFAWPTWYVRAVGNATNLGWSIRSIASAAGQLRRLSLRSSRPLEFSVAVELLDAGRLNGGPSDTNYWEDGIRLKRENLLLFITSNQERLLRRLGRDPLLEIEQARVQGFTVVRIRDLHYSWITMKETGEALGRLCLSALDQDRRRRHNPALAHTYWRAWGDILTWQLLFDSYRPSVVLHTISPDGVTGLHFDSAILTGLCHRFGGRSIGYQNRCIYHRVYEDGYDSYDIYLAWGARWRDVLSSAANQFIKEIRLIGCLHNEGRPEDRPRRHADRGPNVCVFTAEVGGNLFPITVTLNLIQACMAIAQKHPECTFKIKTKDPDMVDVLLAHPDIRDTYADVQSTFEFLRLPRYQTEQILAESEIVIATAWTTPGSDALLLGKRVIFYNESRAGGGAFEGLPDLVAESALELGALFEKACQDFDTYASDHSGVLSELDPYRDGNARRRSVDILKPDVASQFANRC